MVLAAFPLWIIYNSVSTTDWSTEADAKSIHVAIDESLAVPGGFPLGRHVDSTESHDYKVEVSAQLLADGRLHSQARESRDDGYTVELWITFVPNEVPSVRGLVHWWDQSGSRRGFVQDLTGTIRVNRVTRPITSSSDDPDLPFILEYELAGEQRGRPVAVHRKLVL